MPLDEYDAFVGGYCKELSREGEVSGITADGPFDRELWPLQNPKVLFYFKEIYGYAQHHDDNGYGPGVVDIRKHYEGWITAKNKTYCNNAVLAHLIHRYLDTKEAITDEMVSEIRAKPDELCNSMRRVAHINVKKVSGDNARSDDKVIRKASKNHTDILRGQIRLLDPDIIVCGGSVTWVSLVQHLGIFEDYCVRKPGCITTPNGKILCHFNHSAPRSGKLHYNVLECFQIIQKEWRNRKAG